MTFDTLDAIRAYYRQRFLYADGAGRIAVWARSEALWHWYGLNGHGEYQLTGSTLHRDGTTRIGCNDPEPLETI